jgi:hypothetical protein
MSMNVGITKNFSLGGKSFAENRTKTAGAIAAQIDKTVAAAKTGTLTTRTDDNTGEITGQASHGVTTGDRLDVYWSTGHRRGMTVGTVASLAIPIDGGSGDNLPADETPVTMMVPEEVKFDIDGDDMIALLTSSQRRGLFVFTGADDAEDYYVYFPNAAMADAWYEEMATTNPIASDAVTKVFISHADSSNTSIMRAAACTD